jgi:N-acyl-phosphatidylethanolamine-hydrolysing phospholipase D
MPATDSLLASLPATPSQALQIHVGLRARHSLAMRFATVAGSDFEALERVVELERAKREMELYGSSGKRGRGRVCGG